MLKKIILGLILLGALCALFVVNQSNYDQKIKSSDVFSRIPNSALFVFESDDFIHTTRELLQSNLIVQNLKEFSAFTDLEPFTKLSARVDTLFPTLNEKSIQGAISAHPLGNDFKLICHLHLPEFDISYILPDTAKPINLEYDGKEYTKVQNAFFYYNNQVLSLSINENLIKELIRTENSETGNLISDSVFVAMRGTVGKLEKGHLYVFHEAFDRYISSSKNLWKLAEYYPRNYAQISAFDIRYEPNNLSLAGYSIAKPSNTLSVLNNQSTVALPSEYIPNSASNFKTQSFADSQRFLDNFLKQNNEISLSKSAQSNWVKLAYRHYGEFTVDDEVVYFLRVQNQESWYSSFATSMSKTENLINGISIYTCNPKLLLRNSKNTLYTGIVHNTVYASESLATLENTLLQISYDHHLNTFKQFQVWNNTLSGDGNSFRGVNTKKLSVSDSPIEQGLYQNLSFILAESSHSKNQKFYQYILIGYDPKAPTTPLTVWENKIDLDSAKIQLVQNHYTNNLEVAVYNKQGNLKLISSSGKTLWERNLQEPILGRISQIDLFKNKKLQMAFATPSAIHLFDRLGRSVENFPIYIKQEASSTLSLADYDNSKDYRALISSNNGALLNFEMESSKATKGWNYKLPEIAKKTISTPSLLQAKAIRIKKKDYIIKVLEDGQVQVLSRRGDIRYQANITIQPSSSTYYIVEGKDIQNTALVYTQDNALIYHYLNGKKDKVLVHPRENINSFFPLPNSKENLFAVKCANEVSIYKGIELNKTLEDQYSLIELSKKYLSLKNQEGKLEILDPYLKLQKTSIPYGETVLIGSIQNKRNENVISYDKGKIYCYKLETE